MSARCSSDPEEVIMSYIRRIAVMLAGLGGAVLAFSTAAAPAFATMPPPDPGGTNSVPPPATHTVVIGGMPGWQIALIAAGAALVAATVAVLVDRAWAAHRKTITAAA
jgi:hypothetical protein